jgi:hypothetical protein
MQNLTDDLLHDRFSPAAACQSEYKPPSPSAQIERAV